MFEFLNGMQCLIFFKLPAQDHENQSSDQVKTLTNLSLCMF